MIKHQRIRITLKGYDSKILDQETSKIMDVAKRHGAVISGPVLLPTKRVRYSLLRSVHVNSKSHEQFEHKTHRRLIDIYNPTAEVIDELTKTDLLAGIDVQVKI